MDPTITKASTDNERFVAACAESQSTSRGPNRTRFLVVQEVIRVKMQCDEKTLLADADASKKRNLLLVGGHAEPSKGEFEECWSESIIKNGLSPSRNRAVGVRQHFLGGDGRGVQRGFPLDQR
jgi:hypothetical protein